MSDPDQAPPPSPHYRDLEEYQLARALLADVCISTKTRHRQEGPLHRLRKTAVALPGLFLPRRAPQTAQQKHDSQQVVLRDLESALNEASDSGALDPDSVQRLAARHKNLLAHVEEAS